jgi:hypothetical protein
MLAGCEDKTREAASSAAKPTATAPASAPPAQPTAEPTVLGCKAPGDKPMQLGEVHGDVFGFAVDAGYVYYTTWQLYGSRGDLGKLRKDGQGGQPLASLKLEPRGLALDETTVYYTSGIRLNTISKEGTKEGTLDDKFSSQSIAIDDKTVYGVPGNYGPYDRVAKIAKSGGSSGELASAKRPAVKEGLNGYSAIAVDAAGVYVTDSGNGRILKFALGGGKPQSLASGLKKPIALAKDSSNLYFSLAAGELLSVPKAGGKAAKLASGLVEEPHIAGDAKAIYAPFKGTGERVVIDQVDTTDGSYKPIATVGEGRTVSSIALDDKCVYWVERVDAGKSLVCALGR